MNLESSVGHREGCAWGGAGQGATTRNSCFIARSCNADMRRPKRAICGVALLTQRVKPFISENVSVFNTVSTLNSGQLRILG